MKSRAQFPFVFSVILTSKNKSCTALQLEQVLSLSNHQACLTVRKGTETQHRH